MDGVELWLPTEASKYPDRERLEKRFEVFQRN